MSFSLFTSVAPNRNFTSCCFHFCLSADPFPLHLKSLTSCCVTSNRRQLVVMFVVTAPPSYTFTCGLSTGELGGFRLITGALFSTYMTKYSLQKKHLHLNVTSMVSKYYFHWKLLSELLTLQRTKYFIRTRGVILVFSLFFEQCLNSDLEFLTWARKNIYVWRTWSFINKPTHFIKLK